MSEKKDKKRHSIELFSRRRSSTVRSPPTNNRNRSSISSTSQGLSPVGNSSDNAPGSPIPTISSRRSSQSVVFVRSPSMLSNSQPDRKKSRTGSDISDKSETSRMGTTATVTKRRRMSNILTSSFLRRKREEYAGKCLLNALDFVVNVSHVLFFWVAD